MGLSCSSDFGSLWFWLFSGRQIIIQKDLKNRSGKLYDECRMEGVNPDREVEAMWFWWFMLVCNSIYSLTMIIAGYFMWKHCPKKINGMVGYRTKRSMKNQDTWKFAHEDCGKRWWIIGWVMLLPTILLQLPFYGKSDDAIGWVGLAICVIECSVLVCSIIPTEKALQNTFNEDGGRKDQQGF